MSTAAPRDRVTLASIGRSLGPDRLPPDLLERLREQARSAGLNPELVKR